MSIPRRFNVAGILEIGLALFGVLLLVGGIALLAGKVSGGARREDRHQEGPPSPGSVPSERHQNTGAVSSR